MIYSYRELRQNIELYYQGKIELEELGSFCANAYYDIIKGNYILTDNLLIYPLIKNLYRLNIKPNEQKDIFPCSFDEISAVHDILSGKKNISFCVEIGINQNIISGLDPIYKKALSLYGDIRGVLSDYLQRHTMSNELNSILQRYDTFEIKHNTTIFDCVDNYVASLTKSIAVDEVTLCLSNPLGLYCSKRISLDDVIKKIIRCLDFCIGLADATICISYIDGMPMLNLLMVDCENNCQKQ